MQIRFVLVLLFLWAGVSLSAQVCTLAGSGKNQYNMNRRGLPHGNYSGISMIDDTTFVTVSDKDPQEGFHLWNVEWDGHKPKHVRDSFISSGGKCRDSEGIVYHPSTKTVFVSAESDQRIKEYNLDGSPTGRELEVPVRFGASNIQPNGGFESLAYDGKRGLFWTCTELPLKGEEGKVWLQSFGEDLRPRESFAYQLDSDDHSNNWSTYVHGVAELCALDDGTLLVMERLVAMKRHLWGSHCETKIYSVRPVSGRENLEKRLLASFRTPLNLRHWLGKTRFANYEGMCLGPELEGRCRMLILINDSQNGLKGLKEYIKLLKFHKFNLSDETGLCPYET